MAVLTSSRFGGLMSFKFSSRTHKSLLLIVALVASSGAALADDLSNFDMTAFAPPVQQNPYQDYNRKANSRARLNYIANQARQTTNQRNLNLATATSCILSQRSQVLPRTTLDSFVYQAGGAADQIYGDEGTDGPPPMSGMDESHTIGSGIHSNLTTGHSSDLPSAWCTYY